MSFRFLLDDVTISLSEKGIDIDPVLFSDKFTELNSHSFHLFVPNLAHFYAKNGNEIIIVPIGQIQKETIELYLNGSVLGAIMHQRKNLVLHASSVNWNNQGIIFCGDSGVGKSTLTTYFCQQGAEFLTDDVTPITDEGSPKIIPVSDRIKLWQDSLDLLNISNNDLQLVRPDMDKYFYKDLKGGNRNIEIRSIFFISNEEIDNIAIEEINEIASKFQLLLSNIYRSEYLDGMLETKKSYFYLLSALCEKVKFFTIKKPKYSELDDVYRRIMNYLK